MTLLKIDVLKCKNFRYAGPGQEKVMKGDRQ